MSISPGGGFSRREFLKATAVGAAVVGCAAVGLACGGPALSERLSVRPSRSRGDETFVVRLSGLSPGDRAVLSASFDDAFGNEWSSTAVFEADVDGRVDTSKQAPVEGSYDVEDPMGLVWSATGFGAYASPTRPSPVRVAAKVGDQQVTAEARRYAIGRGVEATDVREGRLAGRLFMPGEGARPAPGLLVLGGSEGGLSPYSLYEAALHASRGYAALALAYFRGNLPGSDKLPDSLPRELVRVPLEYFGRALQWLGESGGVDRERLGVVGHSRGGELALLLGATYPELKAVISYVGSGVTVSSPTGEEPAWTFGGEAVPYYAPSAEDRSLGTGSSALASAEIPVEKTNGPVLLIAAGDDALWPSERLSKIAYDRLRRGNRHYEDELAVYQKAGHAIVAPCVPTGWTVARFGGTPEANAAANEDSWKKVLALLDGALLGGG
jgi:dienelactone hydrolase